MAELIPTICGQSFAGLRTGAVGAGGLDRTVRRQLRLSQEDSPATVAERASRTRAARAPWTGEPGDPEVEEERRCAQRRQPELTLRELAEGCCLAYLRSVHRRGGPAALERECATEIAEIAHNAFRRSVPRAVSERRNVALAGAVRIGITLCAHLFLARLFPAKVLCTSPRTDCRPDPG